MKNSRHYFLLFALVLFQVGLCPAASAAKREKSPYADLLPPNTTLQDSPDRLDPAVLSGSMLGVVASSRLVAQTVRWQRAYGEKGDKPKIFLADIMGLKETNKKLLADASDPKRVVDAALPLLKPRFKQVEFFDDLAAAREGGARYFLILDFSQSVPINWGLGYPPVRGQAGALLLDGSFRRIVEVNVERKTKWFDVPLLGMANAYAMASAKSNDENFKVLLPDFSEALNASLTARGSTISPPAPTPSEAAALPLPPSTALATPVDQAFLAELAAIPSAGALFAIGDEMAEKGERQKASAAFRAVLSRFPDDPLAVKAADRLSNAGR